MNHHGVAVLRLDKLDVEELPSQIPLRQTHLCGIGQQDSPLRATQLQHRHHLSHRLLESQSDHVHNDHRSGGQGSIDIGLCRLGIEDIVCLILLILHRSLRDQLHHLVEALGQLPSPLSSDLCDDAQLAESLVVLTLVDQQLGVV